MNFLKAYFKFTRHHYYGLLLIMPLFLLYELGIWWVFRNSSRGIRNLVDIMIKCAIENLGLSTFFASSVLFLVVVLIFARPKREFLIFHWRYYLMMICECLLYSLLFSFSIIKFADLVTCSVSDVVLYSASDKTMGFTGLLLSLGAGIYEEFVFRVLLFGGVSFLLSRLFKMNVVLSGILSALITSIFFSLIHYWGGMGDKFSMYSFYYRLIGGLFFCAVYSLRGFCVAAYTHAIYDVLIILSILR